jgi:hypothetical protein
MKIAEKYQDRALVLYQGVFTVNIISILGNHIRHLPGHDSKILQRIFRIFVEIAQNVAYYSNETLEMNAGNICGSGWIAVQEFDKFYRVTTGNPIKPEHANKLKRYCDEINNRNTEALKILKRETRSQAMVRETGAQLGLIQISILSENKLEYEFNSKDDPTNFFIISAGINK